MLQHTLFIDNNDVVLKVPAARYVRQEHEYGLSSQIKQLSHGDWRVRVRRHASKMYTRNMRPGCERMPHNGRQSHTPKGVLRESVNGLSFGADACVYMYVVSGGLSQNAYTSAYTPHKPAAAGVIRIVNNSGKQRNVLKPHKMCETIQIDVHTYIHILGSQPPPVCFPTHSNAKPTRIRIYHMPACFTRMHL